MVIRWRRFNMNLWLCGLLVLAVSCQSPETKHKKEQATFRLHLETVPDDTKHHVTVPVYRAHPVGVNVESEPFITEAQVSGASIVEDKGGFALSVKMGRFGTDLLERYTTANNGKRIAIFSSFGVGMTNTRWLGAPKITHRIGDGVLTFTPDASRVEADDIVIGLNNVAKETGEAETK